MAASGTGILTVSAFFLVLLGGIFAAVGLFGGSWVGARLNTSDGNQTSQFSAGFGPDGFCYTDDAGSESCTSPEALEERWNQLAPLFRVSGNSNLNGRNVGELLQEIYALMVTSVVLCAFALLVYTPVLVRDLCGSVNLADGCTKVGGAVSGIAAAIGGIMACVAYGLMADSEIRRTFKEELSDATYSFGDQSFRFTAGDTAVMASAITAGVLAIVGGALLLVRAIACAPAPTGETVVQTEAKPTPAATAPASTKGESAAV